VSSNVFVRTCYSCTWLCSVHTHCEAMVQLACTIIGLISLDTYLGECAAAAVLLSNLYPWYIMAYNTTAYVMTYWGYILWQPYCGHSSLLWRTNSFVQYYSWMVRPNCTPIASAAPAAPDCICFSCCSPFVFASAAASFSAAAPRVCLLVITLSKYKYKGHTHYVT